MRLLTKLLFSFILVAAIPSAFIIAGLTDIDSTHGIYLLIVGIVFLMAFSVFLIYWMYTAVIKPIRDMQKSIREIAAGNLDYKVETTGEDEVGQLCSDFEKMRIRLKENKEEKLQYDKDSKELISNISHDLKTPITSIRGYVEGILDGVASSQEKLDKYIRTIYNKTNDMDRLIDELTFYSKIDTNSIPYNYDSVSVMDFFADCAEEVGLEMESKGIEFGFVNHVDPSTVVIADVEQIKRVINNIVSNSIKYLDKTPGIINIELEEDGRFVKVTISDNGQGIAKKDLPEIFNRFYRTDKSRNSSRGGSGIGLSIAKRIIEDHGGRIWAESIEGIGTKIIFELRTYPEDMGDE